jgi:hypothetical protein
MARDEAIALAGVGMAIGSTKHYYPENARVPLQFSPHNAIKGKSQKSGIKRQELFRLFAPAATCRNPADRPQPPQEIQVLIGSETLSVGQNLQDADYLINIDLPWNPMTLEQRIGRIDRPKQNHPEYIYIYYANSESQLLRQASRLKNLNKKLVGDLALEEGGIPTVTSINTLGASVYGDTLFDDPVLPDYVEFIQSLVNARRNESQAEQGNFQEDAFAKQETSRNLYTQQEILHSEDLSRLLTRLGEDYQPNAIALGRKNEPTEPNGLVALSVQYFDPNHNEIADRQELIFWNDQTGEKNAYGVAIATAFKTPEAGNVFSTEYLLAIANNLYAQLVKLKQERIANLDKSDSLETISVTSERLSKIQARIGAVEVFPDGIDRAIVKDTLKKLNSCKHMKDVQKLLRNYTEGEASKLEISNFVVQLVFDTSRLSLLPTDTVRPTSLRVSLSAMLLRA